MERNREWTSFFNSQHQYSTCSLASTTFELRSSDDFILEGRAESERLLSAQIMIFYHGVFKTLANSFLNITTFLFFCLVVRSIWGQFSNFSSVESASKKDVSPKAGLISTWLVSFLCAGLRGFTGFSPVFSLMTLFGQKFLLEMHAANMEVRPWSHWNCSVNSIFVDFGVCSSSLYSQVIEYESGELRLQLKDW